MKTVSFDLRLHDVVFIPIGLLISALHFKIAAQTGDVWPLVVGFGIHVVIFLKMVAAYERARERASCCSLHANALRLTAQLAAMTAARDEACDFALGPHQLDWQSLGDRIAELRAVGKEST